MTIIGLVLIAIGVTFMRLAFNEFDRHDWSRGAIFLSAVGVLSALAGDAFLIVVLTWSWPIKLTVVIAGTILVALAVLLFREIVDTLAKRRRISRSRFEVVTSQVASVITHIVLFSIIAYYLLVRP